MQIKGNDQQGCYESQCRTATDIVSTDSPHAIQYCAMPKYTSAVHDKWLVNRRDGSFTGNSDTCEDS